MNARALAVAVALAALVLALLSWGRLSTGVREFSLDGWKGFLSGALVGEDTVYAAGYSADAFGGVEPGMPREDVHRLLGRPLGVRDAPYRELAWDTAEFWTLSPGDTHHRRREVYYRDGRVVDADARFYND